MFFNNNFTLLYSLIGLARLKNGKSNSSKT